MSKLFNKFVSNNTMFNKLKDAGNNMFNKFKQDPTGFTNKAIDFGQRITGALGKVVNTATPILATAMPEFSPMIMGGSVALNKGLGVANNLLEKASKVNQIASTIVGDRGGGAIAQPPPMGLSLARI